MAEDATHPGGDVTSPLPELRWKGHGLSDEPVFRPGDRVAGRYEVVRFVARGGMGDVYEVRDLELKERVALKTIRPELYKDEETRERFRREIALSRRVTHPNVCRVLELGFHTAGTKAPAEIAFLTMEYLDGEPLDKRLKRDGRLATAEALPIIRQVAEGLAAAHEAGVVHRDLKSGNVMLVPERGSDGGSETSSSGSGGRKALAESRGGIRAVITDFGLASPHGLEIEPSLVTRPGMVVGTAAYMSPEQARGKPVTPRSDVYSLGVLIYEMVTGFRPHQGANPVSTLMRRVNDPPEPPRVHLPSIDRRWEATILRCLEVEPERRFASPREVVPALVGDSGLPGGPLSRRARLALAGAAAAAVAVALLSLFGPLSFGRHAPGVPESLPISRRTSFAVLGFRNLSASPEADWISMALAETLGAELAAGQRVRRVPGETVERTRLELGVTPADGYAPGTLERLRRNLDADFVVVGSYLPGPDGSVRLLVNLQDTRRGETVATVSEDGDERHLPQLVSRAGVRLREALGAGAKPSAEATAVAAVLPGSPEAMRLYAEGLSRLRRFDALEARRLLTQAVSLDPSHALAQAALSEALSALGLEEAARTSAQRARELSGSLPRAEQLAVEARYHATHGRWEEAASAARTLFDFLPDDLEKGLSLAETQISAGKSREAMETVARLRRLPAPAGADPRVDLVEGEAALALADYRRALERTGACRQKAEGLGASLLVASARLLEGEARFNLGERERSRQLLEEARAGFEKAGDREGAARAVHAAAELAWSFGDWSEAGRLFEQSLRIREELGNEGGAARSLQGLGNVAAERGAFGESRKRYEECLARYTRAGSRSGQASAQLNLGNVSEAQGDLEAARKRAGEALEGKRAVGERRGEVRALCLIGRLTRRQGSVAEGRKRLEEALATAREIGHRSVTALALNDLGRLLLSAGDPAAARAALTQALAEREKLGSAVTSAESRLALAELELADGHAEKAESLSREAMPPLLERSSAEAVRGHGVRAEALAALGRPADAETESLEALRLAEAGESPALLREALRVRAVVLAGGHREAEAARLLGRALALARSSGDVEAELGLRLAVARLEKTPLARERMLESVRRDAELRGFGLVARLASGGAPPQAEPRARS